MSNLASIWRAGECIEDRVSFFSMPTTIHLGAIDQLVAPRFSVLWKQEFGASHDDAAPVPLIAAVVAAVRDAYKPFAPSDTLVTKVILGTLGCLPACDRYFIDGFKSAGFKYSYLNSTFIERVLRFCRDNLRDFQMEQKQTRIQCSSGMHYPLMKLVDMYFWQIGYARGSADPDVSVP